MYLQCLSHTFTLCLKGVHHYCLFGPFPYFRNIAGCVVCPDPVLALKSPVKHKIALLGMLCSQLSSLSKGCSVGRCDKQAELIFAFNELIYFAFH